jgi:hypothetical protein
MNEEQRKDSEWTPLQVESAKRRFDAAVSRIELWVIPAALISTLPIFYIYFRGYVLHIGFVSFVTLVVASQVRRTSRTSEAALSAEIEVSGTTNLRNRREASRRRFVASRLVELAAGGLLLACIFATLAGVWVKK